ncbi:MAG: NAD-dependent epimerase/dehydratase family protein [Lactococcus lactis]|nr:NAD-dependent epimerase/dehydratase family protein [Lactococcus lactis]
MTETVLVTGATGFLGGHIIKQLLQQDFKVIGTVRDKDVGDKLVALIDNSNFRYELVELLTPSSFTDIFQKDKSITKVIHTAAPFDFSIQNFDKLVIEATINGTQSLLSAIEKYGENVTHIINTSCLASHFSLEEYSNPSVNLNETSWCKYSEKEGRESPFKANHYSKLEAEKAFWQFIKNHSNVIGISISPAFMFGPQPFDEYAKEARLNTSSDLINVVLNCGPHDSEKIPNLFGYATDVRDVAKLHIDGFKNSKLNDKRLAPFSGTFSLHQVLNLTKDKFPAVSQELPPKSMIDITLFNFDNSQTLQLLDFELTSVDQSLYDSIEQLLRVRKGI